MDSTPPPKKPRRPPPVFDPGPAPNANEARAEAPLRPVEQSSAQKPAE